MKMKSHNAPVLFLIVCLHTSIKGKVSGIKNLIGLIIFWDVFMGLNHNFGLSNRLHYCVNVLQRHMFIFSTFLWQLLPSSCKLLNVPLKHPVTVCFHSLGWRTLNPTWTSVTGCFTHDDVFKTHKLLLLKQKTVLFIKD